MFFPSSPVTDYKVALDREVTGLFEPAFGVLFINVDDARFDEWRASEDPIRHDSELAEIFFHEIYHCLQTYATGYCYAYCQRLVDIYLRHVSRGKVRRLALMREKLAAIYVDPFARMVEFVRSPYSWAAGTRSHRRHLAAQRRYVERLGQRGEQHAERSVAGALYPGLHEELRGVRSAAAVRGESGLSAIDVIEGSAFVYGREWVRSVTDARPDLDDRSLDPDGPYRRLVDAANGILDEWASEPVLAAAAIALRYERPGDAFVPVLERISGDEFHTYQAQVATVSDQTPALDPLGIRGAGAYLGTAAQYHARIGSRNKTYTRQFERLGSGSWGIDELDLLTHKEAFERAVPADEMGFTTLVTRGGHTRGHDPRAGGSLVHAAYLLPDGPQIDRLRRELRLEGV